MTAAHEYLSTLSLQDQVCMGPYHATSDIIIRASSHGGKKWLSCSYVISLNLVCVGHIAMPYFASAVYVCLYRLKCNLRYIAFPTYCMRLRGLSCARLLATDLLI